jgi:hypothetical protein
VVVYLKIYVGIDIMQSLADFGQVIVSGFGQLIQAVSSLFSQLGSVASELKG